MDRRQLLAATLLTSLTPPARPAVAATREPLRVAATFTILADMARQVGGERVAVASLVGPNGDVHAFEPTPADSKVLAQADLVVVNGLGFEGWIDRLVAASGYRRSVATVSAGVAARAGQGAPDPHAWQDLGNGRRYVENLAAALAQADPPHAAGYRASAESYLERIAATDAWVRAEIGKVPAAQRKVVTSHDAFGYFGDAYGVRFVAVEGTSENAEPSAAGIAALIDQIRRERIKVIFLENALSPRLATRIAEETGARIGGTLYADALSAPGGGADSYLGLFRRNVPLLRDAMLAGAGQG